MSSAYRALVRPILLATFMTMAACGGGDDSAGGPGPAGDAGGATDAGPFGGDAAPTTFAIGGTVTGLLGSGLVLRNAGADDLHITANGAFTFPTHLAPGAHFDVSVATQPTSPSQTCVVSGASGVVGQAAVTSVVVNCAANAFTVGGTVSGLVGTVVLRNTGATPDAGTLADGAAAGDVVAVSSNGTFAFPTPVASGTSYDVTIATQPAGGHCTIFPATDGGVPGVGSVGNGNVTTLDVRCATTPTPNAIAPICSGTFAGNFTWSAVADASYTLEYGPQGGAVTSVDVAAGTTSYAPPSPLGPGAYDWRVRAIVDGAASDFSATSTFTVGTSPATPTATSSATVCAGQGLALSTPTVAGATYAWTGPNGFSSTEQNPVINGATSAASGSYQVVVTVGGCASAPGTTDTSVVAGTTGQFTETTTGDFLTNTNTSTEATNNQVGLYGFGNGAEGAFAPSADTTLSGGVHNFTTVTIPAGVTVKASGSVPLVILATGAVAINGTLDVSGDQGGDGVTFGSGGIAGSGVAGGANGGAGIYASNSGPLDGSPGSGPGGGGLGSGWSGGGGGGYGTAGAAASGAGGAAGPAYGTADLSSLLGGSGGGGGSGGFGCGSGGGGGGGGVVRVMGTSISVGAAGSILANGGGGGSDGTGNCGGGGGGSGGAVWLQSPTVTIDGTVSATGGAGGASAVAGTPYFGAGGGGGNGRVRVDGAVAGSGTVTPTSGYTAPVDLGTSVSPLVQPANLCGWGTLTFTTDTPASTSATVDVLDAASSVLAANVASGTSLASLPAVAGASGIHLRVNLSRTGTTSVPALLDWTVTYATNP